MTSLARLARSAALVTASTLTACIPVGCEVRSIPETPTAAETYTPAAVAPSPATTPAPVPSTALGYLQNATYGTMQFPESRLIKATSAQTTVYGRISGDNTLACAYDPINATLLVAAKVNALHYTQASADWQVLRERCDATRLLYESNSNLATVVTGPDALDFVLDRIR